MRLVFAWACARTSSGDTTLSSKTYLDLLPFTQELEVLGHPVRVLSLESLIDLKRELGRPKDLAMLPALEATLRERGRLR